MGLRRPLWVTTAALGLCAAATHGQQQPTFRSATRTVPVYATVTDATGRLVPDLEQGDFEIWDNGKKVAISLFDCRQDPRPTCTEHNR